VTLNSVYPGTVLRKPVVARRLSSGFQCSGPGSPSKRDLDSCRGVSPSTKRVITALSASFRTNSAALWTPTHICFPSTILWVISSTSGNERSRDIFAESGELSRDHSSVRCLREMAFASYSLRSMDFTTDASSCRSSSTSWFSRPSEEVD
jgi:hypothetical protein